MFLRIGERTTSRVGIIGLYSIKNSYNLSKRNMLYSIGPGHINVCGRHTKICFKKYILLESMTHSARNTQNLYTRKLFQEQTNSLKLSPSNLVFCTLFPYAIILAIQLYRKQPKLW